MFYMKNPSHKQRTIENKTEQWTGLLSFIIFEYGLIIIYLHFVHFFFVRQVFCLELLIWGAMISEHWSTCNCATGLTAFNNHPSEIRTFHLDNFVLSRIWVEGKVIFCFSARKSIIQLTKVGLYSYSIWTLICTYWGQFIFVRRPLSNANMLNVGTYGYCSHCQHLTILKMFFRRISLFLSCLFFNTEMHIPKSDATPVLPNRGLSK